MRRVECAVCLEGFKGGDKCRLLPNCRHSFHANCIESWLIRSAACPICRTCVDLERSQGESTFSDGEELQIANMKMCSFVFGVHKGERSVSATDKEHRRGHCCVAHGDGWGRASPDFHRSIMDGTTSMVLLLGGFVVNVTISVCVFMCTPLMPQESIEISVEVQNNCPISEDDIKKLPLYEYSVDQEDDAEEAKIVERAVCLDGFKDGDKCMMLPNCKHSFHANCIDSWLINTTVCPICRTSVEIERSGREDRFPGDVCLELT
nr:zinc finger, RING/FYVE/PHD-type [Tanacetum cinerariifolium]